LYELFIVAVMVKKKYLKTKQIQLLEHYTLNYDRCQFWFHLCS
jgi:hypothetical protein